MEKALEVDPSWRYFVNLGHVRKKEHVSATAPYTVTSVALYLAPRPVCYGLPFSKRQELLLYVWKGVSGGAASEEEIVRVCLC